MIVHKQFGSFPFLAASIRACHGRNVMQDQPNIPGLPADRKTSIKPDGFLFLRAMIRNRRYDQVLNYLRCPIGDDISLR
jgi:hypothetical protein